MNHSYTAALQYRDVSSLRPHDVRRDHAVVQKPDPIEIGHRTGAFVFHTIVNFPLRLGNVSDDRRAGTIRKRAGGLEMLLRNRVRRVRRDRWNNQFMPFPACDKLLNIRHRLGIALVVSNWKVDDGFTQHATNTRFRRLIGDRVFEVIHVAVGRGATANHFR